MSSILKPPEDGGPAAWTVSELTARIRDCLEPQFARVTVVAEVREVSRPRSGHLYLTLRDDHAQIRAVIWRSTAARLRWKVEDGVEVIGRGEVSVYPPRGSYQLILRQIEPRGVGSRQRALLELRQRLAKEGLFAPERKRPLPRFPRRIGVVTSPSGAALHDFLEVLRRRWRGVQVVIVPASVQGASAATEICRALRRAEQLRPPLDVLVLTRGGGSEEDLAAFNHESVVRAVAAMTVPLVTAVGHEVDVTLVDLAADLRALTPTEAAERVLPRDDETRQLLDGLSRRLAQRLQGHARLLRHRLDVLAQCHAFRRPHDMVYERMRRLDELDARARRNLQQRRDSLRTKLRGLADRLESVSPLQVLARGYSVTCHEDGRPLLNASEVAPGDTLRSRLRLGEVVSQVVSTHTEPQDRVSPGRDENGRDGASRPS